MGFMASFKSYWYSRKKSLEALLTTVYEDSSVSHSGIEPMKTGFDTSCPNRRSSLHKEVDEEFAKLETLKAKRAHEFAPLKVKKNNFVDVRQKARSELERRKRLKAETST